MGGDHADGDKPLDDKGCSLSVLQSRFSGKQRHAHGHNPAGAPSWNSDGGLACTAMVYATAFSVGVIFPEGLAQI